MPGKDEEIKIRVPGAMKNAIKALASKRFTSESEIAREALLAYLASRGITLQEEPTPYKTEAEPEISSARKAELAAEFGEILKYSQKPKRKKKTASDAPPK